MALVQVTLLIQSNDAVPVALSDTRFTVLDTSQTVILASGIVGQDGISDPFSLTASASYALLLSKPFATFTVPETLTVGAGPGPIQYTFEGSYSAPLPPADPNLCTVYGYLSNLDGTAFADKTILIDNLQRAQAFSGRLVMGGRVSLQTSDTGTFQTSLVRNAVVRISIQDTSISVRVQIPDEATVNIADLLEDAEAEISGVVLG